MMHRLMYNCVASSSSSNGATLDDKSEEIGCKETEVTFTVDDAIEHFGFGPFQIFVSIFAGISWMAEAMEMMILTILIPSLSCEWKINSLQSATISSSVFAGMVVSSVVWGVICDRIGRRIGIMLISLTIFFFGMCSAFAPSFNTFIILRTLMGFGMGGVPQSVTYYSEFLPLGKRAFCMICMQIFWAVGGGLESIIAFVIMDPLGWRWLIIISTLPMLISGASCLCVPESARFLISNGRVEEAYQTLKVVALWNGKEMPPGKLAEVVTCRQEEREGKLLDLFGPKLLRTTLLIMPIWFISTMSYYGSIVYMEALYMSDDPCHGGKFMNVTEGCRNLSSEEYMGYILAAFTEIPGLFVAAVLIQTIGRRLALAAQFAIFVGFMMSLLNCFPSWTVTALLAMARAIASGAFQTAYVYTPEVYPTTTRAVGLGASSGMGRIGAMITPYIALYIPEISLTAPILIYSALAAVAVVCSLLLPIETRGRLMQDRINQVLPTSGNININKMSASKLADRT